MERLNVLCLHGYHGSARILRRQLAPLVDGFEELATFVCLDAPSLAAGDFGWWHARATASGTKSYEGWQRTLDAVASAFRRSGPFDGVFGFSQGAALTSLLVGLRSGGKLLNQPDSLAFGFAVMVGGFVAADAELARLYGQRSSYDLPSVHIVGRSDAVVPGEASLGLAAKFKDPLILEHEGGHVIPDASQIRQRLRTFLEEMLRRR